MRLLPIGLLVCLFYPQLMKMLPNLDEKNKEKPLCFVYSVKTRALLHAHFSRIELPPNSLDVGKYLKPFIIGPQCNKT